MNAMTQKNIIFPFDKDSAIAAILYICHKKNSTIDLHKLSKLLYFADRYHLAHYAQPITGDTYIVKTYGPVPMDIYNILTHNNFPTFFKKQGYKITALATPDMYQLSDSNISVLDKIVAQYGNLSFDEITRLSHGEAYRSVAANQAIPIKNIVAELNVSNGMLALIADNAENSLFFAQ